MASPSWTTLLSAATRVRLLIGWSAVVAGMFATRLIGPTASSLLLIALLVGIVAVILVCAAGVVAEAEHLAHRLGEPYGTLVLTLSVVLIEVVLIAAVLLGPGEHREIARDSVVAVSFIILNLVAGLALLLARGARETLRPRRAGIRSYLGMLVTLGTIGLGLPTAFGGTLPAIPAVLVAVSTAVIYGVFLIRQTGRHRADFDEPSSGPVPAIDHPSGPLRTELLVRTGILVALMLPIVLLAHDLAAVLDVGLSRLGAPAALSGLLIAVIVFLPETLTTLRAARAGQLQRVSNLCHGALVSTFGLTIPAVLVIGLISGRAVPLGVEPMTLALLAGSLLLTAFSFRPEGVRRWLGGVHLVLFAGYAVLMFG